MTPKWHPGRPQDRNNPSLVPKVALRICNVSPMCTVPSEDLSPLPILTAKPRRGGAAATEHVRLLGRSVVGNFSQPGPDRFRHLVPFQGKGGRGVHQISSPLRRGCWRSRDLSQGSLINDGHHAAMVRFCRNKARLGALRPSFQPRGSHLRVSAFPPRRRKNAVLALGRSIAADADMGVSSCCVGIGMLLAAPSSNTHASGREGGSWWLGDVVGVSYRVGNSLWS